MYEFMYIGLQSFHGFVEIDTRTMLFPLFIMSIIIFYNLTNGFNNNKQIIRFFSISSILILLGLGSYKTISTIKSQNLGKLGKMDPYLFNPENAQIKDFKNISEVLQMNLNNIYTNESKVMSYYFGYNYPGFLLKINEFKKNASINKNKQDDTLDYYSGVEKGIFLIGIWGGENEVNQYIDETIVSGKNSNVFLIEYNTGYIIISSQSLKKVNDLSVKLGSKKILCLSNDISKLDLDNSIKKGVNR
jgi:hypothetical protein